MTALLKADRAEILERALRRTFEPRFKALHERCAADAAAILRQRSPKFYALAADPEALPYLAVGHEARYAVAGEDPEQLQYLFTPSYDERQSLPTGRWPRGYLLLTFKGLTPCGVEHVKLEAPGIQEEYPRIWADYAAAYSSLSALLHSYSVREKLVADFPELAAHMPDTCSKPKLPMVVLKDERAKLAALGLL